MRREKVAEYLRKNMSEIKIAEMLGVARQTVVRDVSDMKKSSQNWLDGLAKDGFMFEYKLALEKIKENGARLENLLITTKDVWQQFCIIKQMDQNTKLYLELLGETPTIHAFRKAKEALSHVSQS